MSKIIVTGGCGYIGSHVARLFSNAGHEVTTVDRIRRDHTLSSKIGFIHSHYQSDVFLDYLPDIKPDVIVHCAGTSLVGPSVTNPLEYYNNNVAGTIKLLDRVSGLDKKPHFLFSSSCSVYGDCGSVPVSETYPTNPLSPYASSKLAIEGLIKDCARAYDIKSVIFRFFNAAGAEPFNYDLGQELGATHIIGKLLESSYRGESFEIYGTDYETPDGTCVRDYVHVWDIARAHDSALSLLNGFDPAPYYIFNLGTGSGTSVQQIVDFAQSRYNIRVNNSPARPGDAPSLVSDTGKSLSVLKWYPQFSDLGTIMETAHQWYCRHRLHTS